MKRLYWIFRAAWYMSRRIRAKDVLDYRMCWRTADVCYDSAIEFDGVAGDWEEAIDEELSCWSE